MGFEIGINGSVERSALQKCSAPSKHRTSGIEVSENFDNFTASSFVFVLYLLQQRKMALFKDCFSEYESVGRPEINEQEYEFESPNTEIDHENDGFRSRFPEVDTQEYGSDSQIQESNRHFGNLYVNFDLVYYNPNRYYNGDVWEAGHSCSFEKVETYDVSKNFPDEGFECPSCLIDDVEEATSEDDVSLDVDMPYESEMVDSEGVVSENDISDTGNDSFGYPPVNSNRDLVLELFGYLESDSDYDDMESLDRYFH